MNLEQLLSQQVINIIQPIVQEYENRLHNYDSRIISILDLPLTPKQIALVLGYKTNASIDRLFQLGELKNVSDSSTRMCTVRDILDYKNRLGK